MFFDRFEIIESIPTRDREISHEIDIKPHTLVDLKPPRDTPYSALTGVDGTENSRILLGRRQRSDSTSSIESNSFVAHGA